MSRTPSQILAASIGAAPSPGAARALFFAHADAHAATSTSTPAAVAALASAVASSLPSVALAYDTAHTPPTASATDSTPTAAHSSYSSASSSSSAYVASAAARHTQQGSNSAGANTGIAMPGAVDVAHDIVAVSPTVGNSGAFLPLEPLNFPLPASVVAGIGAQRAADLASLSAATRLAVAAVAALAKSAQFTTSAQTLARFFKARPGQPPVFASVAVDARKPVNDMEAVACAFCTRAFTMVRRRHHCRCCGDAVCFDCSTQVCLSRM